MVIIEDVFKCVRRCFKIERVNVKFFKLKFRRIDRGLIYWNIMLSRILRFYLSLIKRIIGFISKMCYEY